MPGRSKFGLSGTDLVHGDDLVAGSEVAPSISVSTSKSGSPNAPIRGFHNFLAYRSADPTQGENLAGGEIDLRNPARHIYSRYTQQISTRAEQVLSRINVGPTLCS